MANKGPSLHLDEGISSEVSRDVLIYTKGLQQLVNFANQAFGHWEMPLGNVTRFLVHLNCLCSLC